jgi:hypothetical protein
LTLGYHPNWKKRANCNEIGLGCAECTYELIVVGFSRSIARGRRKQHSIPPE